MKWSISLTKIWRICNYKLSKFFFFTPLARVITNFVVLLFKFYNLMIEDIYNAPNHPCTSPTLMELINASTIFHFFLSFNMHVFYELCISLWISKLRLMLTFFIILKSDNLNSSFNGACVSLIYWIKSFFLKNFASPICDYFSFFLPFSSSFILIVI